MENLALRVLTDAVQVGSWHVTADTLTPIGWLIQKGYLIAEDDYEGPRLFPTNKGKRYVARQAKAVAHA